MKCLKKGFFVMLVFLLIAAFSMTAAADSYNVFGGRFVYLVNGIETNYTMRGVTCNNQVDSVEYPVIHEAIDNAISDWNWHLSMLNSWEGTSYSLINVQQTKVEPRCLITFLVEAVDPYFELGRRAQARTYFYDSEMHDITDDVTENGANWSFVQIKFYTMHLDEGGYDTVEEIQRIANHELGHAFGLAHDHSDTGIIMYGSENSNDQINYSNWTATVPTAHDLLAFHSIYGA